VSTATRERADKPAAAAGRLAAYVTGAAVCLRATADPDMWGHLRFGLDFLGGAGLPSVDPYSFTQDVPWINHEWLSEAIFAAAYRAGGVPGLMLLKAAVLAAAMVLLAATARTVSGEYRGWLLAVTFLSLSPIATAFRPHLWTILGVALVCYLLARDRFRWMPLLFAVWANLHGGWIVGGSILVLWLVGRAVDQRSTRNLRVPLVIFALSAAATLANPYGWRLWTFLGNTVSMSRGDISEWQPYWVDFEVQHGFLLPLALGVFATTVFAQWRHLTWARLLPATWLAISGLMVARTAPLFAEVALFCAATAWRAEGTPRLPDSLASPLPGVSRTGPVPGRWLIDLVAAAAVVLPTFWSNVRCLEISGPWAPDLVTAAAFDDPSATGRLVVPFNWGEYAIWHWGPRLRVSMDGRRETVYSAATVKEQGEVSSGNTVALTFFDRVRPEYAWLPGGPTAAAYQWLSEHGYAVDIHTEKSFVARRADLAPLRLALPRAACFP
jgi:hypothetical protein